MALEGEVHALGHQGLVDHGELAAELAEIAAEALLEPVEAVEGVVGGQVAGHPPEVVDPAVCLDGPANHLPLEKVVGHTVAEEGPKRPSR